VHLGHPVAETVEDELERPWVVDVDAVATAGEVMIAAEVVRDEAVVRGVVEAAETERRPTVVPLAGVVVDDVEEDLDADAVKRLLTSS
jgi:hypothetical protein